MIIKSLNRDLKGVLEKIDMVSNPATDVLDKVSAVSSIHNNQAYLSLLKEILSESFSFAEALFISDTYKGITFIDADNELELSIDANSQIKFSSRVKKDKEICINDAKLKEWKILFNI